MFPFQRSCEFSFQVSGNVQEDEIMVDAATTSSNPAKGPTADYKRKRGVEGDRTAGGGEETKKMQHRDNERQRRVAMVGLLNTLRSLLPLEFVKGKRSVSDHIAETTNFIKHMQNNNKELQDKLQAATHSFQDDVASSSNNTPCSVSITVTNVGLDIQISSGKTEAGFRLSDTLRVLLDQGISVICSVSSKVDGIFHHKIHCQVSDKIDIQRLEQRLYDVVSSNGSSSSMCTGVNLSNCSLFG